MNHRVEGGSAMSDEHLDACGVLHRSGNNVRIPDPIGAVLEGLVHCQQIGPVRTTVHIRVGRRLDLRVQLPLDDKRRFVMGQSIIAVIPAEAVRLEAGLFRRSRQRWNRWYGRIVMATSHHEELVLTAKIHGESWSLSSTLPILGSVHPARSWDPVNIVVDPQAIELIPDRKESPRTLTAMSHVRFVFRENARLSTITHSNHHTKESL
ncbi:MAG: hypothetical protein JSR31_09195 [Nitrospira sp.]|nr:hypothetical protein [Nitrospira sp.]